MRVYNITLTTSDIIWGVTSAVMFSVSMGFFVYATLHIIGGQ